MKSWKTTVSAIAGVILFALSQFDASPDIINSWGEAVGVIGGMLGVGFFSRDDNVTSEESKASEASAKRVAKQAAIDSMKGEGG